MEFAYSDEYGEPFVKAEEQPELPGFNVIRCWKFNSLSTPVRLLNTGNLRQVKPDRGVVRTSVFSQFCDAPENPIAAFAGLSAPLRSAEPPGYYTHITLHAR